MTYLNVQRTDNCSPIRLVKSDLEYVMEAHVASNPLVWSARTETTQIYGCIYF